MKKQILAIAVFFSALPLTTFAAIDVCSFQGVHCSYVINGSVPKYVKISYSVNGHNYDPYWMCMSDKTAVTIDKWEIDYGFYAAGDHLTFKYTQCDDRNCKRGVEIGAEDFYIMKNSDDDYYSQPFNYAIRLIPNFGKACTPDGSTSRSLESFRIRK